jgi:8-oxo-dGTP pyrophosphatase MutT (NUDIX family)
LLDTAGRILLFRFAPGDRPAFWATPGGAVDPGESFKAAARRELLEETWPDMECGREVAGGGIYAGGARDRDERAGFGDVTVRADRPHHVRRREGLDFHRRTPPRRPECRF